MTLVARLARLRPVCLVVLAASAWGCAPDPEPVLWGPVSGERPAVPDFALDDQRGEPFRLSDELGRVVVLFFGYVHCPDVCPTTLSTWARVRRELQDETDEVRFVFVTVDPERDTPEVLARHLAVFGADIVGLHGEPSELEPVYDAFGARPKEVPLAAGDGYLVDHYAYMVLLDRKGRLATEHRFDAPVEHVVHDIRLLLDE